MRKKLFIAPGVALGGVGIASAATFKSLVSTLIGTVFNSLITLAMVVATAAFTFGIYTYVMGARSGDSKQIAKGNQFILWAGITLFVMASIWGIITFGQSVFGIKSTISIPNLSAFSGTAPTSADIKIGQPTAATQSPQNEMSGFSSGAFNNGCDPQDPTCGPGAEAVTTGVNAFNNGCDPLDTSCGQSNTSVQEQLGTSSELSAFIRVCQSFDSTKTYIQCWQQYSALTPDERAIFIRSAQYSTETPHSNTMPVCGSPQDNGSVACSPSNGTTCNKGDGMWCQDSNAPATMPVCGSPQDNGSVACSPSNGTTCNKGDGMWCQD